ncbi:MAG TPA: amino acid adenylation domain-containing protein [Nakamurella sp.]
MTHDHGRDLRAGFLAAADRFPGRPALTVGRRTYSYGEVSDIARRWAAGMVDAIGHRPRRVGVFGYRSETSYIGALASLFAGAAFVPLNPRFPADRSRIMAERADLDVVLVDENALPQLPKVFPGPPKSPAILLPETSGRDARAHWPGPVLDRDGLAARSPLTALPDTDLQDLAYLLFTSGSTGEPKGVPITHGNVRAFLDANQARYRLAPSDRLSQTFDQTFDLSVFDLFMAWDNGASVYSMDPIELLAPFRFLERNQISVWFSVPSVAALLLKRGVLKPGRMPTLRWSLFCGEVLPRTVAQAWQAAAPRSIVENLYGPTELTIACAAYRWDPRTSPASCERDVVPIGEIYQGLSHIQVDEQLNPVPNGEVGELCVAGPQTSPGYWRAPGLTAQRFFSHTDAAGITRRYYRTGDLVRRRVDHYVYQGRNDHQVKIGGYRIELGEIEAVLRRAGAVEAVALPWPTQGTPQSVAAVVSGVASIAELSAATHQALPTYMVPSSIHALDMMPLNSNGKIDRRALAQWLDEMKTDDATVAVAS